MLDLEQIAESEELFDGRYRLMYPLSTDGATADIWLAVDTNTVDYNESDDEELGLKVAIKVYRPQNALDIEGIQRFRNEFKVVFNCQHTNLLHPVHFSIYKDTPYLVLPYCQNGSCELLVGQVQKNDDIWKFISDVASGLEYLHTNNPQIIHQDVKPANILIDDKRNYTITDFGISIESSSHEYDAEENSGTLAYMAPERFTEAAAPLPESDIWALGATIYELITGQVPFGEDGGSAMLEGKIQLTFPPKISKHIKKLIIACLDANIANRPTAAELVEAAGRKVFPLNRRKKGTLYGVIAGISAIAVIVALYLLPDSNPGRELSNDNPIVQDTLIQKKDSIIKEETPILSVEERNAPLVKEKEEEKVVPNVKEEKKETVKEEKKETKPEPNVSQIKDEKTPKKIEVKESKSKSLDLGYAIWRGKSVNGKPVGAGVMTYKESHRIDSRDPAGNVASKGEQVEGNMINGHWEYYKWIKTDGTIVSNYIGQ